VLSAALALSAGGSASGCDRLRELLEPPPANCDERSPYYPDRDGDGVGEPGAVYLGCEAVPGWTEVPPPADTDPADTDPADTDPADTDPADTDPADTDPADSDPADSDPGGETGSPEAPPP
jgi:hypothetical protein